MHLSTKDTNVNQTDGILNVESTSIATSKVLPPSSSPIPTSVPVLTISPAFFGVMQEPITTLFSYQSTTKSPQGNKGDDEDIMVSFADIQFNQEEEDIPDDLIMLGK